MTGNSATPTVDTQLLGISTETSETESIEKEEGMPVFTINRQWFGATDNRTCGTCAECCTWLGIDELKKWTGQTCKHLDGHKPEARCTIYESRPKACVQYYCMWRAGFGPESLQPSKSGMLLTPYQRQDKSPDLPITQRSAVTILLFDEAKANPIREQTVMELIMLGISEIRLINVRRKMAMLYRDGKVYKCRLLKPTTYEELTFETDGVPIASYATVDTGEPVNVTE